MEAVISELEALGARIAYRRANCTQLRRGFAQSTDVLADRGQHQTHGRRELLETGGEERRVTDE